jgi:uncharacterized membrane protein YraQ (UPF0718 family)
MVATPIINPAAAFMAFGLLGTELATAYILSGICIPPCIAYASRLLAPGLQFSSRLPAPVPQQEQSAPCRNPLPKSPLAPPRQELALSSPPRARALPRFPGRGACT